METEALSTRLWIAALTRADRAAAAWLCGILGRRDLGETFLAAYAAVQRKVGGELVSLSPAERTALAEAGADWPEGRTLDELSRAALLVSASLRIPRERFEPLVAEVCRSGDERARRAARRALPLLHLTGEARAAILA